MKYISFLEKLDFLKKYFHISHSSCSREGLSDEQVQERLEKVI